MTEFVSTRVGVKFSPPTLGVEYKNKSSGEKDALKVDRTDNNALHARQLQNIKTLRRDSTLGQDTNEVNRSLSLQR